jgi:hypothetical protein
MDNELKMAWTYVGAVFGHWGGHHNRSSLVSLDLVERAFWDMAPSSVDQVTIGVAVLVLAQ